MAPELGKAIRGLIDQARAKTGRTSTPTELRQRAQTALETGDYEALAKLAPELQDVSQFEKDLQPWLEGLNNFLRQHGLETVDVTLPGGQSQNNNDLAGQSSPAPVSDTNIETRQTRERKDLRRNDTKYVNNASAKIALALIQINNDKTLAHKDVRTISVSILKPERNSQKDLLDAHHRYETTTSQLGVNFLKIAKESKSKSVSELINQILDKKVAGKVNDPEWKEFYEKCKENFGQMKTENFVEKILQRFYTKEEKKVETEKQKEAQKERKPKKVSDISPSKIEPVFEILLCNRLLSEHVVEALEKELLNGKKLSSFLKEKGVITDELRIELNNSRETMGNKRKNIVPTPVDFDKTANFVLDTLRHMQKSLRGWHTMDKKLTGFRTLLALAQEFHSNENFANKIWSILYTEKNYKLDSHGFPVIALPGTDLL